MTGRPKYKLKCQTINKQNKLPCKAKGILMKNGKARCKVHGGFSKGQTTLEGKIKAYRNLTQFKNSNDEEIRTYITNRTRHHKTFNEWNSADANIRQAKLSILIKSLQLDTREQRLRKQDNNCKKDSSSNLFRQNDNGAGKRKFKRYWLTS